MNNVELYKNMLEKTYSLEANGDKAKQTLIQNLQDFLCAGLVMENGECVPTFQNGRLVFGFALQNNTHICQNKRLESIFQSLEKESIVLHHRNDKDMTLDNQSVEQVKKTKQVSNSYQKETTPSLNETKEKKEEHSVNENEIPQPMSTNEPTESDKIKEIEDAPMPIYVIAKADHDVRNEYLVLTWEGSVRNIGVTTATGKKFHLTPKENGKQKIHIRNAEKGSNVKLSFEGSPKNIDYKWETKKHEIDDIKMSQTDLELNMYDISVKDDENNESCKITVMPLTREENGLCDIVAVVEDMFGEKSIFSSNKEKSIEIVINKLSLIIQGRFENDEFFVDIFDAGEDGDIEKYDIDMKEIKWKKESPFVKVGHPVKCISFPGTEVFIHVVPLTTKNESHSVAPIGVFTETRVYTDDSKSKIKDISKECYVSNENDEVLIETEWYRINISASWNEDKTLQTSIKSERKW